MEKDENAHHTYERKKIMYDMYTISIFVHASCVWYDDDGGNSGDWNDFWQPIVTQ